MIDAPLEKILDDDCRPYAGELLAAMNKAIVMPAPLDVMAAIRAVAVALDAPPPAGTALKIYLKTLKTLPLTVLWQVAEALIKKHGHPSFPKPGEWLGLGFSSQRLFERARFMIQIYDQRRKVAEMHYRPRTSGLRKPAEARPAASSDRPAKPPAPGDFDLE